MKNLYLEITHRCNLHCPHCYNMSGAEDSDMDIDTLFHLISDLTTSPMISDGYHLAISGGEPLLREDIITILRKTTQHPQIKVTLLTNGLLLNKIIDEFLLCPNPINIQISLDGMSEKSDDSIRGKGHFKKVTQIIQNLSTTGYHNCDLKMTINQVNYTEIEDFIDFSLQNNCIPRLSFLLREGNAISNWNTLDLSLEQKIVIINRITKILIAKTDKLKSINKNIKIEDLLPSVVRNCPLLDEEIEPSVAIKPTGEVQPCQALYNSFFSIGNIHEKPITYILDSKKNPKLSLVRSFLHSRKDLLKANKCHGCILQYKCNTGCLAQAISDSNSAMELDNFCTLRRSFAYTKFLKNQKGLKA